LDEGQCVTSRATIAIIDDDDTFRAALLDSFGFLEYDARAFDSVEGFLSDPAKDAFQCVITDIRLPGRSGLELPRCLSDIGSGIPVVMITAQAEADLTGLSIERGAFCLLRKPFEINDLIDCLERALGSQGR
jgi:FixJ family two-component response regulator